MIAITESDNDELDAQCEYVVRVPSTADFLTPLLCVLPLQVRLRQHVRASCRSLPMRCAWDSALFAQPPLSLHASAPVRRS